MGEKDYYFIRVGSDSSDKVPYSMIINGELLFIPITEICESEKDIDEYSYQELQNFEPYINNLSYFGKINQKEDFLNFHLDPFFNFNHSGEYSYCDKTKNDKGGNISKAIALNNLEDTSKEGKYIFFLATTMTPSSKELEKFKIMNWKEVRRCQEGMKKKLALIGYMQIQNLFKLSESNFPKLSEEIQKTFPDNPHTKRIRYEEDLLKKIKDRMLIFLQGNTKNSLFLFKNPLILGESKNKHYELEAKNKKFFNNTLNSFGYRAYKFFNKSTLNLNLLLKHLKPK